MLFLVFLFVSSCLGYGAEPDLLTYQTFPEDLPWLTDNDHSTCNNGSISTVHLKMDKRVFFHQVKLVTKIQEFPPAVDGILMDVQYTNNSSRAMCYNSTRIRIGKAGLEVIWDRRFMNLRIGGSNGRHLEDVIQQSTHQRYLRTINCLSDSLFSDVHLSGFEVKGLCSVLFENECPRGLYGAGCNRYCSRSCGGENRECHALEGWCKTCEPGRAGRSCEHPACPSGKFGLDGCTRDCHKECGGDGNPCRLTDGSCFTCDPGWTGTYCQYRWAKYRVDPIDLPWLTDNDNKTCYKGEDTWIRLEMEEAIHFHKMMLVVSNDSAVSVEIELDVRLQNEDYDRPCTNIQKRISRSYRGVFTIEGCSYPQYVTSLVVYGPVLKHLCSVYIERGCPAGKFGSDCTMDCNEGCGGEGNPCHPSTGKCFTCDPGKKGDYCNWQDLSLMCPHGKYGDDCALTCSDLCQDSMCRKSDGHCTSCQDGYKGKQCEEKCPQPTWGWLCLTNCSKNCRGVDDLCHYETGDCLNGCDEGFVGKLCDKQCSPHYWGLNCDNPCNKSCGGDGDHCNNVNGHCTHGCDVGYIGNFCEVCEKGHYGDECAFTCPADCPDSCHHLDGRCDHTSCPVGHIGENCERDCPGITWGKDCNNTCSGSCAGTYSTCIHTDGLCDHGCDAGFSGFRCDRLCPEGTYGDDCKLSCNVNCAGSRNSCHHANGRCLWGCDPGHIGVLCDQSEDFQCSVHCAGPGDPCDQVTRHCAYGCDPGYIGSRCTTALVSITGCPQGWRESIYSGTCIKKFPDLNTWQEARETCQDDGGDLVEITSSHMDENLVAVCLEADDLACLFFIGLRYNRTERKFFWLDDNRAPTYFNWNMSGTKSPKPDGDCVAKDSYRGSWRLHPCDLRIGFICEKTLVRPLHVTDTKSPELQNTQKKTAHKRVIPNWRNIALPDHLAVCPTGWTESSHSRTCIKVYKDRKSWQDARDTCKADHGELVKILDFSMNQLILYMVSSDSQTYWIGLRKIEQEEGHRWLDGAAQPTFLPLGEVEPNPGASTERCVETNNPNVRKGLWSVSDCKEKKKFICERSPISHTLSMAKNMLCPDGWVRSPRSGTCFKFFLNQQTWTEARDWCKDEGGDLVKIENRAINEIVNDDIVSRTGQWYWTGLNDLKHDDTFFWLDDVHKPSYTNWGAAGPAGHFNSPDCVAINGQATSEAVRGQWVVKRCWEEGNFICERNPGPTPCLEDRPGWFGQDCRYKCHCGGLEECDKYDGSCVTGCEPGWFGEGCQYALASYSARAGDGTMVDWLLDMNDTTCKEPNTEVWITMDKPAHLKWIRIILDNVPDTHGGLKDYKPGVSYLGYTNRSKADCTAFQIGPHAVDLYCSDRYAVTGFHIVLFELRGARLCSFYVSAGSNIAINERTEQSSSLDGLVPNNFEDGDAEQCPFCVPKFCNLTDDFRPLWWKVRFQRPVYIQSITVRNRVEIPATEAALTRCGMGTLKGVILGQRYVPCYGPRPDETEERNNSCRSQCVVNVGTHGCGVPVELYAQHTTQSEQRGCDADEDGFLRFVHTRGTQLKYESSYSVITDPHNSQNHLVSALKFKSRTYRSSLTLCGLEVFGAPACPDRRFGLGCLYPCNCRDTGADCWETNGICTSGCADGYVGSDCQTHIECPTGMFGPDCRRLCNCLFNTPCSVDTGGCPFGCAIGYTGEDCHTHREYSTEELLKTNPTPLVVLENTFGLRCNQDLLGLSRTTDVLSLHMSRVLRGSGRLEKIADYLIFGFTGEVSTNIPDGRNWTVKGTRKMRFVPTGIVPLYTMWLRIDDLMFADSGVYQCTVTYRRQTHGMKFAVDSQSGHQEIDLRATARNMRIEASETFYKNVYLPDDYVVISCTVDGPPDLKVRGRWGFPDNGKHYVNSSSWNSTRLADDPNGAWVYRYRYNFTWQLTLVYKDVPFVCEASYEDHLDLTGNITLTVLDATAKNMRIEASQTFYKNVYLPDDQVVISCTVDGPPHLKVRGRWGFPDNGKHYVNSSSGIRKRLADDPNGAWVYRYRYKFTWQLNLKHKGVPFVCEASYGDQLDLTGNITLTVLDECSAYTQVCSSNQYLQVFGLDRNRIVFPTSEDVSTHCRYGLQPRCADLSKKAECKTPALQARRSEVQARVYAFQCSTEGTRLLTGMRDSPCAKDKSLLVDLNAFLDDCEGGFEKNLQRQRGITRDNICQVRYNLTKCTVKVARYVCGEDFARYAKYLYNIQDGVNRFNVTCREICPRGWSLVPGAQTCVKVFTWKRTWTEAREACGKHSDLVTIRDDRKQAFVWGLVQNKLKKKRQFWIGLNDRKHEAVYVWGDETIPDQYVDLPDYFYLANISGDCAVRKNERTEVVRCNERFKFVCERRALNHVTDCQKLSKCLKKDRPYENHENIDLVREFLVGGKRALNIVRSCLAQHKSMCTHSSFLQKVRAFGDIFTTDRGFQLIDSSEKSACSSADKYNRLMARIRRLENAAPLAKNGICRALRNLLRDIEGLTRGICGSHAATYIALAHGLQYAFNYSEHGCYDLNTGCWMLRNCLTSVGLPDSDLVLVFKDEYLPRICQSEVALFKCYNDYKNYCRENSTIVKVKTSVNLVNRICTKLAAKTNDTSTGVLNLFDSMSKLRKDCVTHFFESLKLRDKMSFESTFNASSGFPKNLCRQIENVERHCVRNVATTWKTNLDNTSSFRYWGAVRDDVTARPCETVWCRAEDGNLKIDNNKRLLNNVFARPLSV